MPGPALNAEQWVELVKFYHDGHTQKECGVRFGVDTSTVRRHFKKHPEIPRRKAFQRARPEDPALVLGKARAEDGMAPPGSNPRPRRIASLKGDWVEGQD